MKNRKKWQAVLLPSLLLLTVLIGTGVQTMIRYADAPGDWHFIAATVGVSGLLLLIAAMIFGVYKSRSQNKTE